MRGAQPAMSWSAIGDQLGMALGLLVVFRRGSGGMQRGRNDRKHTAAEPHWPRTRNVCYLRRISPAGGARRRCDNRLLLSRPFLTHLQTVVGK